jgi:hypothetical protein
MSVFLLDNFSHYLQARASRPENDRAVRALAITISREAGTGAVTVAELVRQRLTAAETAPSLSPWAVFDANLAKQVLKDHQLPPRFSAVYGRGRSASSGSDCGSGHCGGGVAAPLGVSSRPVLKNAVRRVEIWKKRFWPLEGRCV